MLGTNENPASLYPSLTPETAESTLGENPAVIQNPPAGRQRQGSISEDEEIQKEMQELRRRDEEEYHRKQQEVRNRIDLHLRQNGGDLSLLLSQRIPNEVNCIQLSSFGTSKNVQTAKIQLPLPMNNEVLIRAHSCGVSFNDVMTRNGMLDNWVRSLKPPVVMGSEVAGEIIGLGKNVTDFNLGDRVLALPERKAWSEYVVCRAEHCFKIPDEMNYHDAVALTVDGMVAYSLLFPMGNLCTGKAVLLHPTPGGLGTMVTQMARSVPNTRIFKIAMNREEGGLGGESADEVVHYIEHDADYVSEIRHSSPHGVDLVLDCQYHNNFQRDFNLLRPMGKYVLFGTHAAINRGFFDSARSWWGQERISPLKLYEENKSVCGFNLRNLLYFQKDRAYVHELFEKICKMWEDGQIKAVFDCVLQFDDFPEALQRMQENGQGGKIILDPRMTKAESLQQRDYFVLAEKNVKQRRWQQKPLLQRLGFPEPGDLAKDKPLSPEEERVKQQEQEQQQPHGSGLIPNLFPVGAGRGSEGRSTFETLKEKLTPSFLSKEPEVTGAIPQSNIETTQLPEAVVGAPTTQEMFPNLPQPPPISPYSVENILSHLSTSTEPSSVTPSTEVGDQPVLTKEKVELTVPLTKTELRELKEDLPGAVTEESKREPSFLGKLRSE
ncbi:synaptic vesicle membrane protein VAT-1 homolog-like [Daphnia carinata]|uniref:synaptic vesicle membrane protein VAT-1 homolog-like n=1 Tax=Daphnia carinata TaxID=120202 RepID=UPI00257E28B2|nr:synaptic vesicle membrane protein VAT-1 homolog-like [Daphnia carinata]